MTKRTYVKRGWWEFPFPRWALPDDYNYNTYERRRLFDNRCVFTDMDNNIVENPARVRQLSKCLLEDFLYFQTHGGKRQKQIANE